MVVTRVATGCGDFPLLVAAQFATTLTPEFHFLSHIGAGLQAFTMISVIFRSTIERADQESSGLKISLILSAIIEASFQWLVKATANGQKGRSSATK